MASQDYQEHFNVMVCHISGLLPLQKVDLFVGGNSKHICVNIELRGPQDL